MSIFDAIEIKSISILGCGWLGKALAKELLADGYQVKGSTTSPEKVKELRELGVKAFEIRLLPEPEGDLLGAFLDTDLLIIAIPPGTQSGMAESYHPTQLRYLNEHLEKAKASKVIYISSTSVYPTNNQEIFESTQLSPHEPVNKAILFAEKALMDDRSLQTTVLRCGGLMGYDRIPGKYFAGKKDLQTAKVPVNFVHRDDVVAIIKEVIRQQKWGQVYNVVAPKHPSRQEIYELNASHFGFARPEFDPTGKMPFKTVNSSKIINDLDYTFKFPDPMKFTYSVPPISDSEASDDPHEAPDVY